MFFFFYFSLKKKNPRFYLITMDEFSSYKKKDLNEESKVLDFNYKWLLRLKTIEKDGKKIYTKPIQLSQKSKNDTDNLSLRLKYFVHGLKQDFNII